MNISEIYYTLQGEGVLIGTPSLLVRFSGCNLNCLWCDTPNKNTTTTLDETSNIKEQIKAELLSHNCDHVIFTGGEPTLHQDQIKEIMVYLRSAVPYIIYYTIETNATNRLEPYLVNCPAPILYSLSPKLSSSGNRYDKFTLKRVLTDLLDSHANIQIKLCVDLTCLDDLNEVRKLLSELSSMLPITRSKPLVILQPVCKPTNDSNYVNLYDYSQSLLCLYNWVKEITPTTDVPIRVLPQFHKIIWGFQTGGV